MKLLCTFFTGGAPAPRHDLARAPTGVTRARWVTVTVTVMVNGCKALFFPESERTDPPVGARPQSTARTLLVGRERRAGRRWFGRCAAAARPRPARLLAAA